MKFQNELTFQVSRLNSIISKCKRHKISVNASTLFDTETHRKYRIVVIHGSASIYTSLVFCYAMKMVDI